MKQIPDSWRLSTVREVTLPVCTLDAASSEDREIQYIDIGSIDNQRNRITEPKRLSLASAPSRARQIVKSGDVLFATVRPYLRNIARVPDSLDGEIASTGFAVLRPANGVEPAYLFYKSISQDFVAALTGEQYGVSYPAVKDEQVRAQPIELPPTNEQRRIVAKIEELFSELDKGVESLTTARAQLNAYRQSVLKHAFEGKLTEDWRANNTCELEAADRLSAKLLLAAQATTKGGRSKSRDTSSFDLVELRNLPHGWAWLPLGGLFDVVSGGTPKGVEEVSGGEIPFYKISDMNRPGNERLMRDSSLSMTERERQALGLTLRPAGTVIFPKRGGAILTNKKRVLSRPSTFDLNTMGIVNRNSLILDEYVWYWFQALDLSRIYDGSNVPQINNKNVEPLPFPVCSFKEQKLIVERLEKCLSEADFAQQQTEREIGRAEALRQSILRRAFTGQLVSQVGSDEPASVLLERIRAEQEEGGAKKRRNTKNAKKEAA